MRIGWSSLVLAALSGAEARDTGRTVAALVRERLETPQTRAGGSVFAITSDLAGSLAGGSRPATNNRRRFRRS